MLSRSPILAARVACAAVGGLTLAAACSGPGNTGRTAISDELATQIPWVNGREPARDGDGAIIIPALPQFPAIGQGLPDLDPVPPADCGAYARATRGVEFSKGIWYETFEPREGFDYGAAEAWAGHDDKTEGSFRTPGEFNAYTGLAGRGGIAWGIPADRVPGPQCDDEPNDWAFHFKGGRFNRFGAGVEHPLALIVPCPPNPETPNDPTSRSVVCPPPLDPGAERDTAGLPTQPTLNDEEIYAQSHAFWDVSYYDGISFWARRGPEGQGALTTIIQDKHTSNDLNKENNTYCRRVRPCWSRCLNGSPCTENLPNEPGILRCFDPSNGDLSQIPATPGGSQDSSLLDQVAPRCGESACTSPQTFIDRDFDDKECRPFTFDAHESGEFCFDESDPPPPDTGERCGDGYAKAVTVTPYWQFYKVRFSEMRQQGFGKVSPNMDLTNVHAVAFIVSHGWADFYLDNVSFYREPR